MQRPLDDTLVPWRPAFDAQLVLDDSDRVLEFVQSLGVPGTFDRREVRSIRERGHLVAGLRSGNEWIGFSKLGWGSVFVLDYGVDIPLPTGAFFVLESFVRPEWRGRGAGRFMLHATSIAMGERGFTTRISHIRLDNAPMLALGFSFGYRPLGIVSCRSIFGRCHVTPHPETLLAQVCGARGRAAEPATTR